MSFSSEVREELARIVPGKRCCRKAELIGLFKAAGSLTIGQAGPSLFLSAESASVARKAFSYLKLIYGLKPKILVRHQRQLRAGNVYLVGVDSSEAVSSLIRDLGVLEPSGALLQRASDPKSDKCCARSLLRGLFLGAGSITAPGRAYHLEILLGDSLTATQAVEVFARFGITLKTSERKNKMIVYSKQAQDIADTLNLLGAHESLMKYEDVRAYKNIKSRVNRIVNMETANLTKIARAAARQVEDIRLIDAKMGLSALPKNLEGLARTRLRYPDVSLNELGQLSGLTITKSGINHRMRRLARIAEDIRRRSDAKQHDPRDRS